jgi:hypothetical protein
MSGEIDPLFANHPDVVAMKKQTRDFINTFKRETNPMTESERVALTYSTVEFLLEKDGDRDHMNHSNITCEQSMGIVELLREWMRSVPKRPADLGEMLAHANGRTTAGNDISGL